MSYRPLLPKRTRKGWTAYGTPVIERSAEHLIDQARRYSDRPVGPYICPCGKCGRRITNWTQECFPEPWWDTTGLPPRPMKDRCKHHNGGCAYRDDDPYRCPRCHTVPERCTCKPAPKPVDAPRRK